MFLDAQSSRINVTVEMLRNGPILGTKIVNIDKIEREVGSKCCEV